MVKPFTLSKAAKRAMERAAKPGRAAEPEPVYAYAIAPAVASHLDSTRFDVRTVVVRRDHKPFTAADLAEIRVALNGEKPKRKTAGRRAAARIGQ